MAERDSYLSRILGEDALRISTQKFGAGVAGTFEWEMGVKPLDLAPLLEGGSLGITKSDCAGHFLEVQTLPAYRMLEICASPQREPVRRILGAKFKRIVTPGDVVTVSKDRDETKLLRTNGGEHQYAAGAKIVYSGDGLKPHEVGILLEIAAQTAVENIAAIMLPGLNLFYPLIFGVGEIDVVKPQREGKLVAFPRNLNTLDRKNRTKASIYLVDENRDLVATVNEIEFEFATAGKVRSYEAYGRNF